MTHRAWNPCTGGGGSTAARGAGYDAASFSAGQDAATRVAACIARHAALELVDDARWWNRWRRRLMARALVACAEELECEADERGRSAAGLRGRRPGAGAAVIALEAREPR